MSTIQGVQNAFGIVREEAGQRARARCRGEFQASGAGADDVGPAGERLTWRPDLGLCVRLQLLQVREREFESQGARHDGGQNTRALPLSRIAWLLTVAVAAITGVILLVDGYTGYGILSFVVGLSAAINLR